MGVFEHAWIMLGSNQGDAIQNIHAALKAIQNLPNTRVLRSSKLFVTKPVLKFEQPNFINAAVQIKTQLGPVTLLKQLQKIEAQAGRDRSQEIHRYGPRVLDLDILTFGSLEQQTDPDLVLPHPQLTTRSYVQLILKSMDGI